MLVLSITQLFATPWIVAPRVLCPWNFSGMNTGAGCHFILQGIFLTRDQTRISCIGRQILYHLTYQVSPVACQAPLSMDFPRQENRI